MSLINIIVVLVSCFCFVAAFFMPFVLEQARRKKSVATRPYRWGYFVGFCLLATPCVMGIDESDDYFATVLALFYFPTGYFVLKRKRWAAIVGTVLTLNPLHWVITGIYFAKRWREFTAEARASAARFPIPEQARKDQPPNDEGTVMPFTPP